MSRSKQTKVGMVVFSYYPSDPRVRREAEALGREGIEVDIICLRGKTEKKVGRYGSVTTYRVMGGAEKKENFFKYLWFSSLFCIIAFLKLQILSLKTRYNLIQTHNMPDYLVFSGIVHKVLRRPIILDLHDLTPELFESKWGKSKNRIFSPIVRLTEKIACNFSDHVITTSRGFRDRLLERGVSTEKITLVMNSADEHIFSLRSERKWGGLLRGPKLLYHGTVAERFGLHIAVEAVKELRESLPETQLHIYGKYDPSYRVRLVNMISRLGLGEQVFLHGFVSLEEIAGIIEGCDIGVVPYLSDTFMDLALSTKIFEYVSMGMPVVASSLPSLSSLFGDDCIKYFAPGEAADLGEKIFEYCRNPESRKEYSRNAFMAYKNYSWSIMERRYVSLVKTLTNAEKI